MCVDSADSRVGKIDTPDRRTAAEFLRRLPRLLASQSGGKIGVEPATRPYRHHVLAILALCLLAAVWPAIAIGRAEPLRLLQAGRGTM
ncbi:MAG: hypothetical protein GXY83_23505 [Rhodopirellula sp.]|nr:hypothetical protein [Rhodopirellula sp.]